MQQSSEDPLEELAEELSKESLNRLGAIRGMFGRENQLLRQGEPACQPASLPASLPACLPACLPSEGGTVWNLDPAHRDDGGDARSTPPNRLRSAGTATSRIVLIVEDRTSVSTLFVRFLKSVDCRVLIAASLAEALAMMARMQPDVIVLDLRLPDSFEHQTLEAVFARRLRSQVIVVSGFLTTDLAVKAVRLGAVQVFDKPITERHLREAVQKALEAAGHDEHKGAMPDRAEGAAAHLVNLLLRALDADRDLKKLDMWATHVGLSVTMLRQACYLTHLPPHDARDFVRALVAVVRGRHLGCEFDLLLDIADTRTRDAFLDRAGLTGRTVNASLNDFLARQQFVPADHEVLRLLREALKR